MALWIMSVTLILGTKSEVPSVFLRRMVNNPNYKMLTGSYFGCIRHSRAEVFVNLSLWKGGLHLLQPGRAGEVVKYGGETKNKLGSGS